MNKVTFTSVAAAFSVAVGSLIDAGLIPQPYVGYVVAALLFMSTLTQVPVSLPTKAKRPSTPKPGAR